MPNDLDRLTSQLYHLPTIIGRLGISIAEAQKELNADYLRSLKELARLIEHAMKVTGTIEDPGTDTSGEIQPEPQPEPEPEPGVPPSMVAFAALLKSLAPSRYQFTETTIDFSADLSEHLSVGAQVGASAGIGAVMVNAALSVGKGRDYRAAARVKTVLQAFQSDEIVQQLLDRAATINSKDTLTLPERSAADDEVWTTTTEIRNALMPGNPIDTAAPSSTKKT